MGNKISKLTDRLLIRATFDLSKRYIQYSFLDNLAIILLEEESSMALHILSARLSRETLRDLPRRIKEHITHRPQYEELSPEEFLIAYRRHLTEQALVKGEISTAHILRDIIADSECATSQILAQFGVTTLLFDSLQSELSDIETGEHSVAQFGDEESFDDDFRYHRSKWQPVA